MADGQHVRPAVNDRRTAHRLARRRARTVAVAGALLVTPLVGIVVAAAPAVAATSGTQCAAPAKVTAAQSASTTGLTAKSLTVGNVSIISGPVPGLFKGAALGVKAYFAYINSKGGVNGRTLSVNSLDTGFNGQQNQSETQSAVASDFALVGSFSLFDSYGCKVLASNPAVPDVSVTLDSSTNSLPNVFSAQPLAVGNSLGPLQFMKKKYPKATTVGTIVSTTATAVAQWDGEEAAFKHVGYKIGYVDLVSPLASDFTTDVINMRNKGVNFVNLTALDWQVAAIFTQDMVQQNWHPAVVYSGGPMYADQFISKAGGASATNGFWIGQAQALYLGQDAKSVPADATFLKWLKKVTSGWTPDLYTLYGWSSAQLFAQALQAAGKSPTRGSVLAQLKKITSFNASGLLAPSNPAKKLPASCFLMAQIKNGKYGRVQPAKSGFSCNTSYFYADGKPS